MNILASLCAADGICTAGVCACETLIPRMTDSQQEWLYRLMPAPQCVFIALFPYRAPETPGNLSIYARGRDYHTVVAEALGPAAAALSAAYPDSCFRVLTDDSPLPEVYAAACAGLGCIGENGLLIHPEYGSYVFIGTILTDLPFAATGDAPSSCIGCGACRRVCPVGLEKSRCISALTQQGGTLTPDQEALVRAHPLIWGCDSCQTICPMNAGARETETPAFRDGLIASLSPDDLRGLTRRQFLAAYPARAFTWRGPAPLRRNLDLKKEDPDDDPSV